MSYKNVWNPDYVHMTMAQLYDERLISMSNPSVFCLLQCKAATGTGGY